MAGGVRGVLLDSSALLVADGGGVNGNENENALLKPGAEYLLRKLRHSNIPTGISYGLGLPTLKVGLLERISKLYSFDIFILESSSIDVTTNEVVRAWGDNGGSILHVACTLNEDLFVKLSHYGWRIVILRSLGERSAYGAGGPFSFLKVLI